MDSRRLSCSFIALAASSISANIFGLIGAVCEMTALPTESTLSTAPQHGQVTSKAGADLAITASYRKLRLVRFLLDGKQFEQAEPFPSQQKDRKADNDDGNR